MAAANEPHPLPARSRRQQEPLLLPRAGIALDSEEGGARARPLFLVLLERSSLLASHAPPCPATDFYWLSVRGVGFVSESSSELKEGGARLGRPSNEIFTRYFFLPPSPPPPLLSRGFSQKVFSSLGEEGSGFLMVEKGQVRPFGSRMRARLFRDRPFTHFGGSSSPISMFRNTV